MRHRGYLPKEELKTRSQLAKVVHRKPFLQGSLVNGTFKCGKSNCRCAKAKRGHVKCYLSIRIGGKRKMVYVPKPHEKQVREWVKTYKGISKGTAKISEYCLRRIKQG